MKRELPSNHHPGVAWDLMLVLVLAVAPSMTAAAGDEAPVAVRTFNYAQLPDEQLANARLTTDIIFARAGISLRWIDCRVPQSESGAPCTEPLGERGDLILRLMDIPLRNAPGRIVALGASMLDREQHAGVLMTIDMFPIRAIAEKTSIDLPTLVGRTLAHEMGHLLLGSSEHTRVGLMRAFWSHEELRGLKPAHWQFTRHEAAHMRHGLAVKARTAN